MRSVLIVSHGQPSEPLPAAHDLSLLAHAVGQHLPDWDVRSATLADAEDLERTVRALPDHTRVFPMFMAGGWFARIALPARLAKLGAVGWQVLEPFGCDPRVHDLAIEIVQEAGAKEVILAAHGSFKSSVPSAVANHVANKMRAQLSLQKAEAAFIDQSPQLAETQGFGADAVCLPFFAANGGHVAKDIPAALSQGGFKGRLLPALGTDPRVPALIAAAIKADVPICAETCRWDCAGLPLS